MIIVTVSGPVGSGKSIVLNEIEVALRAVGVDVRIEDATRHERNSVGFEDVASAARTLPPVTLIERVGK